MGNSEYDRIRHKNEKWVKMQKRLQLEADLRKTFREEKEQPYSEEEFATILQKLFEENGV